MVGVMRCSRCGKIINLSDGQYKLIEEMWSISAKIERITRDMKHTGIDISFGCDNILQAMSKTVKCCDDPFLVWSRSY